MQTLQIPIEDRIINRLGIQAVRDRVLKELEYLYFEDIGNAINEEFKDNGINNEKELENARSKAWENYKSEFLKGI